MKVCFLFPGQGAQYPGMGKDLWESSQKVKDLFKAASEYANLDLEKLIFSGTAEDLKATDKTQLAVTLVNLAAAQVLNERGIHAAGTAGFSLGEYAALHEAGVLTTADLFPVVKARGEIMEQVSRSLDTPEGNPGMAAVIGLKYEEIMEIFKTAALKNVYPANYNSPLQIVISGTHDGLLAAQTALLNAGAKRFIPLKVSGPFHCPLLKDAEKRMQAILADIPFADPQKPVYSNVTGELVRSGGQARELCIRQITSPVQWVTEETNLLRDGFDCFLETGPGNVLSGLFKKLTSDFTCYTAGKLDDITNSVFIKE